MFSVSELSDYVIHGCGIDRLLLDIDLEISDVLRCLSRVDDFLSWIEECESGWL